MFDWRGYNKSLVKHEVIVMKIERIIHTIDGHTEGEPVRVVVGGFPYIPGKSMVQKMHYVKNNLDNVVTAILWEPRGHDQMYTAILVPPVSEGADFGVIYRGAATDYIAMCGHLTIGVATIVIEAGMVEPKEPITTVTLDTPAGIVTAKARVENGNVRNVTIRNVPCFLYKEECPVKVPGMGEVVGDIAFGGNFYFIVDAEKAGIDVEKIGINRLIDIANKIRKAAELSYNCRVVHPLIPEINKIDATVFIAPSAHLKADYKVIYIRGNHIDRSPCGTGTSAVIATLYSKGYLKGDVLISESILGTLYKARIVDKTKVGDLDAIIPEIIGKAWIHGFNTIIIDKDDPFKYGFRLREKIVEKPHIDPYLWISEG